MSGSLLGERFQEMPALVGVPVPKIAAHMLTPDSEEHGRQKYSQHHNYLDVSNIGAAAAGLGSELCAAHDLNPSVLSPKLNQWLSSSA